MRIRSIKPEFWTDEDVASWEWPTRLLFVGLWSYVDDNGVGRDNEKLIKADLFPLEEDPRDTLATVSRGLQALFEAGRISRYSVDGKAFLHITHWDRHQKIDRPAKSRYPLPTCENAVPRDTLAIVSRHPRDTPSTGAGEQGNRGAGEQGSADDVPPIDDREDVERICRHMADRMVENGCNRPPITQRWRDAARLMLDKDKRTEAQVIAAINWATNDSFWRSNVMSLPKLRIQYEQLRLAAQGEREKRARASDPHNADEVMQRALARGSEQELTA